MTYRDLLLQKIDELNHHSLCRQLRVMRLTKSLTQHIRGEKLLDENAIKHQVNELLRYTVLIPIPIPFGEKIFFTRANIFLGNEEFPCYEKVSRLSYIPEESGLVPNLGRMNKQGEILYYCCWDVANDSLNCSIREVQAEQGQYVNVLISSVKESIAESAIDPFLYIGCLGIYDYFRKEKPLPFLVNKFFKETYLTLKQNLKPQALNAMQACDEFLTNALLTPSSERLYQVTSEIAQNCLAFKKLDGLIYPSTHIHTTPSLVLKTNSVDQKLQHLSAVCVKVPAVGEPIMLSHHGVVEGEIIKWFSG
jgi:hypothetical protein